MKNNGNGNPANKVKFLTEIKESRMQIFVFLLFIAIMLAGWSTLF